MSNIISYVYDFLTLVFENIDSKEINEVVLFGSVAKKIYDKKSDIDLFFSIKNIKKSKEIEEQVEKSKKSFYIKAEKTWALKNIKFPIRVIVGSLNEDKWLGLKEEIASSGITLYSKYKELPVEISQKYLIYYSLADLKRKDKMNFLRKVFGYSEKKGKKEYRQEGLAGSISIKKLGSNVILIERENLPEIKQIFGNFKIDYKIIESWIRE